MRTAEEWNSLPSDVFPEKYDLDLFKARVNRHFLDAEQGLLDGTLQPLLPLASVEGSNGRLPPLPEHSVSNGQRPTRPGNLGPLLLPGTASRHPHLDNLMISDTTPSSVNTTPNSSPIGTGDTWPRKWRRSDRRLKRLNTELLEAIESKDFEEVERLLKKGANPNATCRLDLVSACHYAAMAGGNALALLLDYGAEKHRLDRYGRTPLHLAVWAGNPRQIALLLDFPEDICERIETQMSSEAEEEIRNLGSMTKQIANVRCDLGEVKMLLPSTWKDSIDHKCLKIPNSMVLLQPGWTPLHVSASCGRKYCTHLLLAAGADPNICDINGRTPLDVAGTAIYHNREVNAEKFTDVIKMLLMADGEFNTMKNKELDDIDTPLHVAVELECMDAINELLDAGASLTCLNAAGLTPLHVCVAKKLEEPLHILANYNNENAFPMQAIVDVKDKKGHTVLQAAVEAAWVPGVCVALEAGANVGLKAHNGETPVHSAAALGNIDVLNEILSLAQQKDFMDCKNDDGETALFKAILNGHTECVKALLKEGACISTVFPGDVNVLHLAAENGHTQVLEILLTFDEEFRKTSINNLTAGDRRGFGPIHFAVSENHLECVKLLLSHNADIRLRTTCSPHRSSTPLHIAAVKNYSEIAKTVLNTDKTIIHEVNSMGWFPLHSAAHHGSRDVIMLLIKEGADLSGYTDGPPKFRRTAIDMIMNNLSKPTEFLEDLFDSSISTNNQNLLDQSCEISVDYRILKPTVCEMEQMKVIEAMIKTGNRYGQRKLLVHPLVESFLYLKWKALLPFFYTIIAFYAFFVTALTVFTVSVFFYKDTEEKVPVWLNTRIWGYIVYSTISLILLQELLYMNVKSSRYFFQVETWVKFGSLGMATILPIAISFTSNSGANWPRHVATIALLLSWLEMMFLLSRFPNWGYYVLMFGKVASNVIKILLTFAFLVIGFSLSFMIQFHSQIPFETPWAAFVKTMVMMTSEFDYVALFDEEHAKELATSMIVIRIIFVIFLVLAAIVLMNLLVGVAVNDINDLEILGNIRRLAKQVEFLGTLDVLVYNKFFNKILPRRINERLKNKKNVQNTVYLCPGKPRWKHFKVMPSKLRDAIFNIALKQNQQHEHEENMMIFRKKIDEMYDAVVPNLKTEGSLEIEEQSKVAKHEDILKRLENLEDGLTDVNDKITAQTEDSDSPVAALYKKVDQMFLEIQTVKDFLVRLESKLGKAG